MQHRFFYNGILKNKKKIIISKKKIHHFMNLRIKKGEKIILFNGLGGEYIAFIIEINKKKIYIKICDFINKSIELPYKFKLIQAIVKKSKMNWIIEKSTELGVYCIQLLKTKYCNLHYNKKKIKKKIINWENIIKSSSEQCGRNTLMKIFSIKKFSFFLKSKKKKILFSPNSNFSILNWAKNNIPQDINFLIGPEGGFSKKEENFAKNNNVEILSLGPRILRTETAGITVVNILKSIWNII
ncbi:16S rRNA (uracil(1498)-N(3))-methyltransferase [Candidatus Zinderia endosymbiont of Aphrophora alni]|uniref:16S rRNA (uracil(1498)-N(3))-methyltransferase n=1 Tax=Candidatus Zinderia endosymbiont of Aphrophora alni TaxID=3077951 RepID=UPI0030D2BF4F